MKMGRKCSYCGKIGHNSRTCSNQRGCSSSSSTVVGGLKLFGVQLDVSSSFSSYSSCVAMRKSLSLDCLSATSSTTPSSSPTSSRLSVDHEHQSNNISNGYVSDGLAGRAQERKKGVPWTEEEHRIFLVGLEKLGKGDWRGISRNFVTSRTPTQVASHAQKYFLRRQTSLNKSKRRPSLFDAVGKEKPAVTNDGNCVSLNPYQEAPLDSEKKKRSVMDFQKSAEEKCKASQLPPTTTSWAFREVESKPTTFQSSSSAPDLELTLSAPRSRNQPKPSSRTSSLPIRVV
ncbi:hypothetical protein NMG60_11000783 [Bertholletia excelsa]